MRGRKPAPAALKLLSGRSEGRDSGGREVVDLPFLRVPPTRPRGMSATAAEHWDFLVDQLTKLKILTPAHTGPLEILAETYSRWKDADRKVRRLGQVVELWAPDALGSDRMVLVSIRKNPWVTVAEAARRDYVRMATEFGLTPSAEQRVTGGKDEGKPNDNPFAQA